MASIIISGDTSGTATLNVADVAGTYTLTFPASNIPTPFIIPGQVSAGGTGVTSATPYAVLCGGTTSTGAFQSVASVGSAGQALTSNGPSALPSFQFPAPLFVVVDTTAGTGKTFSVPSNGTYALVRAWGGGGSGGRGGATDAKAGGGGGGSYTERYYKLSDLGVAGYGISYNVAAGGAAVAVAGVGNVGGNTTFANGTSQLTAYGGGGGYGNSSSPGGGGGAGVLGSGVTPSADNTAGTAGTFGGGAGGAGSVGATASIPWGGGGGGGYNNFSGGDTFLGGGGGGASKGNPTPGGASVGGGNGGSGSNSSGTPGGNGTQPGGGGGNQGANGGSSGKGGDGRIEIWIW